MNVGKQEKQGKQSRRLENKEDEKLVEKEIYVFPEDEQFFDEHKDDPHFWHKVYKEVWKPMKKAKQQQEEA